MKYKLEWVSEWHLLSSCLLLPHLFSHMPKFKKRGHYVGERLPSINPW